MVRQRQTALSIDKRFLSDREMEGLFDRYNEFGGMQPKQGDVVLVLFAELLMTDEWKKQARKLDALVRAQGGGESHSAGCCSLDASTERWALPLHA
ncbi:MAG: hypothetical protein FWD57_02145 [Polyangiaceae bacterium]|nr:hypothetical protein [Polyangiaceae bacterium]